jgi:Raf kinase inhibitor-like YbhB/YbcL family protein
MKCFAWSVMILAVTAWGCRFRQGPPEQLEDISDPIARATMKLTSSAFDDMAAIARKYTADGDDISPPLAWTDVPGPTVTLALICDDPDAPSPARPAAEPWVHWVLYDVPAETRELPAGIPQSKEPGSLPGARQGTNSWKSDNIGYRGPAPPPGSGTHRYVFHLYALDSRLELAPGADKSKLLRAMKGHVLAEGKLTGTYQR